MDHCRPGALPMVVAAVILLGAFAASAQSPADRPSAADLFADTLAADGLDAAVAALAAVLADTSGPYAVDGYELVVALPARLVVAHKRTEALALIEALQPLFGDDPRYAVELGKAQLRCGRIDEARASLGTACAAMDNRPDLVWMLANLDTLAAVAVRQAALEDRLVPGASTGLRGPCLGQAPPGRTPRVFAPGILSTTAHEYHLSIAPDGREIVFSRSGVGTLVTRLTEAGWTVPEPWPLLGEDHLAEEANFTPDGRALVFCGRRDVRDDRVLYRMERLDDGWGVPQRLFPGMYATATLDGALYHTARGEGRDIGVIVRRSWDGVGYGEPVPVPGEGINTPAPDAHPWIAPDESLLLFDSYREPGAGIYAAFGAGDGSWSPPVSLHDRLGHPAGGAVRHVARREGPVLLPGGRHVLGGRGVPGGAAAVGDPDGPRALSYGTNDGSGWSFELLADDQAGFLTAICVDGAGTPHIAYCDSSWRRCYGYRTAAGWIIENMDLENPPYYRASPSLVIDASGGPHLAAIERETVHYSRKVGGSWVDEHVPGSWLDNDFARAAIAIDSRGAVRIGTRQYYASARLFTLEAGGWISELVGGAIAYNPWMVLDADDAAHFVYHGSALFYATNADGPWREELVDDVYINEDNDIAVDAGGRPYILYTRATMVSAFPFSYDLELVLASRADGAWATEQVDTLLAVASPSMSPRLEIDASGMMHILYRRPSTGELRYGTRPLAAAAVAVPPAGAAGTITGLTPNPFNPRTEIAFRLETGSRVSLRVYDLAGRCVRSLLDAGLDGGEHTLVWDGRTDAEVRAPSGVYIFRLESAGGRDTRRGVLVQ